MLIKFNPTGTHIHKGYLKIRLDVYPSSTDKTYIQQYVGGILNPCLCHFLVIDSAKTQSQLITEIQTLFDVATLISLDDALSQSNINRVSQIMNTKLGSGATVRGNLAKLVNDTNVKFDSLQVEV